MLKKLYQKDQSWFAILFIIVYIVGTSVADQLSRNIGVQKSITTLFFVLLIFVLYGFIKRNAMQKEYGLCKVVYPVSKWVFYAPLALVASVNLWFGVQLNMTVIESAFYAFSMLLVGFLEELIFRGLLFKALSKSNMRAAIIVSSITFGMGHIINLINGSGAELVSTLYQIVYASALGFLFVTIFYCTKSLWPCIITHSVINALSTFINRTMMSTFILPIAFIITLVSLGYALFLWKTVIQAKNPNTQEE
ncbi:MAG: CPBP family intramembrane metalloprotease [Oscillospiraceae bacterium]|nr:CPBP family intramembrane metalloprotease [Oscillospiraceae bacterium]